MKLDTTRSDAITSEFLARKVPFRRTVQVFGREYSAPAEAVFQQFCPSREADWINGWTVELLYSETGYAEPLSVFRTPESNQLGAGIWILNRVEPNSLLEATVFQEANEILEHVRLDVVERGGDRCAVTWTITMTALSEKGNSALDGMPEGTPAFVDELEYFLTIGSLRPKDPDTD